MSVWRSKNRNRNTVISSLVITSNMTETIRKAFMESKPDPEIVATFSVPIDPLSLLNRVD